MVRSFFDQSRISPTESDGTEKIDKTSYLPAYVQLANILKQRISAGIYEPGSRLPSEASLAKHFGLSAMTARQAVGVLAEEGLVKRVQGSGTFVQRIGVATSHFGLDALRDVFMDKDNLDVRILKATVESAQGAPCSALGVANGERLVVVERLILYQGHPFTIQVGYARFDPESPIVETMLDTKMLTGLFFENTTSCFMKGELRLLPAFFNEQEAELLNSKAGACAFRLEHIFYDFSDQPASFGWFTVSPEKMPLISKVGVWNE
ncbi:Transcriptional regulator, GntR family [Desulfosarcina cetonica]|uniref:GntR family transcriptional regulator n=1 Tax=Desulfosarcina cetonica TaxID=90730 RepID=UPI0006D2547F|nr:GntR family transcriptional regulator [Desulfosarcina cetonica]VTR67474.1 Transcriptional regulator, GntR family [Desulfosarcina cetonica]